MRRAALALLAVVSGGCSKGDRPAESSEPGPSASVVSIAAALGECADLAACARECDGGTSDRCRRLGVNYEFGKGVGRDEVLAIELYAHACDMKNSEACLSAGRMYEFHHGVDKDDPRAVSFYRRSCDLDDPAGCANLAIMLENGRGTTRDTKAALELFERACARGAGLACERARALRGGAPD